MPHGQHDPFPKHGEIKVSTLLTCGVHLRVLIYVLIVDVLLTKLQIYSESAMGGFAFVTYSFDGVGEETLKGRPESIVECGQVLWEEDLA